MQSIGTTRQTRAESPLQLQPSANASSLNRERAGVTMAGDNPMWIAGAFLIRRSERSHSYLKWHFDYRARPKMTTLI
jgi:hypothetical protein